MKMTKIKIAITLLAVCHVLISHGQQESMFTQFIYNTQILNPAYIGYKEALSVTAVHRSQWVGFKGAPNTQNLSIYSPLKKRELAVGMSLMHDKIGPTRETNIQGDISYRFRLTNRAMLSYGLKFSAGLYQIALTDLTYTSAFYDQLLQQNITDDMFQQNTKGLILPNVGFGVYYFRKEFFAGISSPKLIRNKLEKRNSEVFDFVDGSSEPTVYLMGGYLFDINKELKFQPSALIKGTLGAPLSMGLFANLLIQKEIKVGAFYHFGENFGGLVQYQMTEQFKMGYSLDFGANRLIRTNFGSHEVMLNYTMNYRRKRVVYPRYF